MALKSGLRLKRDLKHSKLGEKRKKKKEKYCVNKGKR